MANRPDLSVELIHHEQAVIICPVGRVSGNNLEILESAVQEQMDAGPGNLVFDLERLSYISSVGLQVLLRCSRQLGDEGGKVVFCALNEDIDNIFEISGFSDVLNVQQNRESALVQCHD